jgi:hypothetical protein
MSEPPLLPLQGRVLDMVEVERTRPRAPDGAKTNVAARLRASIAAAGESGAEGTSPTRAAAGRMGRAGSHAIAFAAGGIVGAAVCARVVATRVTPARSDGAVVEQTEQTVESGSVSSGSVFSADNAGPVPPAVPRSAPAREAVAPESDLRAERALLDKARAALGRGENDACLASVKAHADSFPRGRLGEEREALAIKALVNLGRAGEARQRGARFRAHYPRSLLLPAVESALDSIP